MFDTQIVGYTSNIDLYQKIWTRFTVNFAILALSQYS